MLSLILTFALWAGLALAVLLFLIVAWSLATTPFILALYFWLDRSWLTRRK